MTTTAPTLHVVEGEKPVMTVKEAEAMTATLLRDAENLTAHVFEAVDGRIWIPLKYESWNAYCAGVGFCLPRKYIPELRAHGMSTRAIAAAAGVSNATVHRTTSTVTNVTVDPTVKNLTVTGLDGRTVKARHGSKAATPKPINPELDKAEEQIDQWIIGVLGVVSLFHRITVADIPEKSKERCLSKIGEMKAEINKVEALLKGKAKQ